MISTFLLLFILQMNEEQRKQQKGLSKAARQAAAAAQLWAYATTGPPKDPVFDAEAEAAAAVRSLVGADVVLTSYTVLQQEVYYSGASVEGTGVVGALRKAKRYKVPECPLLQLDWWRLVLDEAQMVGVGNVALMADRLTAVHRWAVTGTPIENHGLEDLQGLLRLIKAAPLADAATYRAAIVAPYQAAAAAAAAYAEAEEVAEAATAAACGVGQAGGMWEVSLPSSPGAPPAAPAVLEAAAAAVRGIRAASTATAAASTPAAATAAAMAAAPATAAATREGTAAAAVPVAGVPAGAETAVAAAAAARAEAEGAVADAVRRLAALLKPLMWRVTKVTSNRDHPLPPRKLSVARLRFTAAEQSFYDHIVDKTAAARSELLLLQQQQQDEEQRDCRQAGQENGEQEQQQQEGVAVPKARAGSGAGVAGELEAAVAAAGLGAAGAAAQGSSAAGESIEVNHARGGSGSGSENHSRRQHSMGRRRGRAGHASKAAADALEQLAARELLQLRLACIHPQLTGYWRELSAELQLKQGGALSIVEILGRMKDGTQLKLQNLERDLCCALNALAVKLLEEARQLQQEQQEHKGQGEVGGGGHEKGQGSGRGKGRGNGQGKGKRGRRESDAGATAAAGETAAAGGGGRAAAAAGETAAAAAGGKVAAGGATSAIGEVVPEIGRGDEGPLKKRRVRFDVEQVGVDKKDFVDGSGAGRSSGDAGAGPSNFRPSLNGRYHQGQQQQEQKDPGLKATAIGGGYNTPPAAAVPAAPPAAPAAGVGEVHHAPPAAAAAAAAGAKESDEGSDAAGALVSQALALLEDSFQVGENGIGAQSAGETEGEELDIKGADATIRAWRFMQLHTSQVLADQYRQMGR